MNTAIIEPHRPISLNPDGKATADHQTPGMRAVVCPRYGSPEVLQVEKLEKPVPKAGEVLVKVHAASVTAADSMMRTGTPFYGRLFLGLLRPKNPIPGTGFSGEIEALGKDVKRFKKGDEVFGEVIFGRGTSAEYVCVPEDGVITTKPGNLSHEGAAPVCDGAVTSMNFLRNMAQVQSGQQVLVNGASGSLGTAAIQLAKHFGAEVSGVCSRGNTAMVKSLGADHVIDYAEVDFTRTGQTYDVIYDSVGRSSFSRCRKALSPRGVYLSPVLSLPLLLQMLWTSKFSRKKAKFSATGIRPTAELRVLLEDVKALIEAGKLRSVIDRRYRLEEIVEAHRYVETGRKKGNVVVMLAPTTEG